MRKMLRRSAIGLATAVAGAGLLAGPAMAQTAQAEALKVLERDHILGKPDAPITIVEYASLTCSHCGHFHQAVLPDLKKKWIDSGRARLVYRDFPLDRNALQAAQVAECSGPQRYFGIVELLFQTQDKWAPSRDLVGELARVLKLAGISEPEIRACLADEKRMKETVLADYESGEKAGVTATPTLFINGQRYAGSRSFGDIDAFLEKIAK